MARVEPELVVVAVGRGIDGPQHPGDVGGGGRAQAGEGTGQVIGRCDRVVGVGGLLEERVEDRLEGIVTGPAGAADDQRVGPRGRDRGVLDHDVGPRAGRRRAGDRVVRGVQQGDRADQAGIGRQERVRASDRRPEGACRCPCRPCN